jgi:integrase
MFSPIVRRNWPLIARPPHFDCAPLQLSVEQPIAGDEVRAIKRHLATRTDALPWLFVSERGHPLTRQAVNDLIAAAAERAGAARAKILASATARSLGESGGARGDTAERP